MTAHRHQLDYLWTAVTPGRFLQRTYARTSYENDYEARLTLYAEVAAGEFAWHDLENVGDTDMIFTTVELENSANEPLEI